MKKYIILISILLFSSMAFSSITVPVMSIFTRVERKHNKIGDGLLSTTGIEFMVGKKIYFYTQARVTYIAQGKEKSLERNKGFFPTDIGALIGVGRYLFDKRNDSGRGWSMVLNTAVGVDFSIISPKYFEKHVQKEMDKVSLDEISLDNIRKALSIPSTIISMYAESAAYTYRVPFEINMNLRYNISKSFALQFGLMLGSDIAFKFDNNNSIKPYYDGLRYGLSVGLAF